MTDFDTRDELLAALDHCPHHPTSDPHHKLYTGRVCNRTECTTRRAAAADIRHLTNSLQTIERGVGVNEYAEDRGDDCHCPTLATQSLT